MTAAATSLFGQLDRSLHDHLGDLVRTAQRGDDLTAIDLARTELPKMVTALRALLDEHTPDEHGRCPTCRSRRFSRRSPSPCRAYLAAHLCLMIAQDGSAQNTLPAARQPARPTNRHSHRFRAVG